MTLEDLIAQFRIDASDTQAAPLWSDEELVLWFKEAQEEAALRANLLYDDSTPEVCEIDFAANPGSLPLHEAVYEIEHAHVALDSDPSRVIHLTQKDRLELTRNDRDWRIRTGEPRFFVQDEGRLRLVPTPTEAGTVHLEAYRLPITPVVDVDSPLEIAVPHRRFLVEWVLYRAFSKPDADGLDPKRAAEAEAKFTAKFGLRVDADMRRAHRANVPHYNKAHW